MITLVSTPAYQDNSVSPPVTNRWLATECPNNFRLLRQDFLVNSCADDGGLLNLDITTFTGLVNDVISVYDLTTDSMYTGTVTYISGTTVSTDIVWIASMDITYLNDNTLHDGYYFEGQLTVNGVVEPLTIIASPDSKGYADLDVSGVLRIKTALGKIGNYSTTLMKETTKSGRFTFEYRERWYGYTGPWEGDIIPPIAPPHEFIGIPSPSAYFVSPVGNDSNPGDISHPWLTWHKAFTTAVAGDIVYIRGGVYYHAGVDRGGSVNAVYVSNNNGSPGNTIKILNYPGETPILDMSICVDTLNNHIGVAMENCQYWLLSGLVVQNVTEATSHLASGIDFYNQSNTNIELCTVHDCGSGINMNGFSDYNNFINCDSYNNVDFTMSGGYSNGFGITMYGAGAACHTSMTGCRAWSNSDDGFDFYSSDGSYRGGYVTLDRCWSFNNGLYSGNGVGFKFGQSYSPKESGIQRTVRNCLAWGNTTAGFDESQDIASYMDMNFYNNTAYNNGTVGFLFNYTEGGGAVVFRNNLSYQNATPYTFRPSVDHTYNSWNGGVIVTNADFESLDDTGATWARQSDGSLPNIPFLKLVDSSDLIDAGIDVGLPYNDAAPDIGCYEYEIPIPAPVININDWYYAECVRSEEQGSNLHEFVPSVAQDAPFLTMFDEPVYFPGLPFDISFILPKLAEVSPTSDITITMKIFESIYKRLGSDIVIIVAADQLEGFVNSLNIDYSVIPSGAAFFTVEISIP